MYRDSVYIVHAMYHDSVYIVHAMYMYVWDENKVFKEVLDY